MPSENKSKSSTTAVALAVAEAIAVTVAVAVNHRIAMKRATVLEDRVGGINGRGHKGAEGPLTLNSMTILCITCTKTLSLIEDRVLYLRRNSS